MTCYNKCSHEQEILDRLANIENKDLHTVQTVNGVYGPFITLDFPDIDTYTELVNKVDNAIYVKNLLDYSTDPITFKARVIMHDNSVAEKVLPPVTEVNLGIMTPEGYQQIWKNKSNIEKMMAGSVIPAGNLNTSDPTQEQLTALWVQAMTDQPSDGDRLMNLYDNVVYLFASGVWYPISLASTPQATNSTLGTVKGSVSDGKCQVELDGTLSVNGWDSTQEAILDKVDKVPAIHTYRKAYCIDSIEGNNEVSIVVDNPETCGANNIPTRMANGNILLPSLALIDQPYYAVRKDYVDGKIKSASSISILTTDWVTNTDSADLYALGYLYQYTIPVTGMLATMIPSVIPDYATFVSSVLWFRAQSVDGGITIYSKTNVGMTILTAFGQVI